MVIQQKIERDSRYTSPIMRITREQIELQNAQTLEEAIKFMPSVQIRQRFPGDSSGLLSIRGADLFSTGRSMVFVDGMPIHNFLQATFNGSPRWSLVGPNEIETVDVVYGGFSAENSGNAIGGVVNITTRMPQKREFYTESSVMVQPWKNPYTGDSSVLTGNREFGSYGDRFKDRLSVLMSVNRIENHSQPQIFRLDNSGLITPHSSANAVTGGVDSLDPRGIPVRVYGDTGVEHVISNLGKIKLGFDITPTLLASATAAYEDRSGKQVNNTYLTNTATGLPYYGTIAPAAVSTPPQTAQNGSGFDVPASSLGYSVTNRETLQLGGGVNGKLHSDSAWRVNSNVSYFNVLKDTKVESFYNPSDPTGHTTALADTKNMSCATCSSRSEGADGQKLQFNRASWLNADFKLSTDEFFGNKKISLLYGYHYNQMNLDYQQSLYSNIATGTFTTGDNPDTAKISKGQTAIHAGFGQAAYRFLPGWDITTGVRLEAYTASGGKAGYAGSATSSVEGPATIPDKNLMATSPKVSLGYETGKWKYRYSFGKSTRFPVIAEIFQSQTGVAAIVTANANLKQEDATQHNISIDYLIPRGFIRASVFRDDIQNAIQSVRTFADGKSVTAFQNIDKTYTNGVELVFSQQKVLNSKFDFSANGTWLDAEVESNKALISYTPPNSTTRTEYNLAGKNIIRLPKYRANYFLTYHATNVWDLSFAGRFTGDAYMDLDNKDYINTGYGAMSGYHFMDFKTNYRFKIKDAVNSRVSVGINNLSNQQAWVAHPYTQRMFFAEIAFSF
jgi:iron complex outermembrane receptor protein